MSVTLVDARSDSLTVSWPASDKENAKYRLEYSTTNNGQDFELLSDKLSQPQARKRNLTSSQEYWFRVQVVDGDSDAWVTHSEPFVCLSQEQEAASLAAPVVSHPGLNQTLHIAWKAPTDSNAGDAKYEIQMRENQGGSEWKTIAPAFAGTEVKKKNLASEKGYQFRVRVVDGVFSPPSEATVARGLSPGLARFFTSLEEGTLVRHGQTEPVPLADALGGKEFVLLYASAHWCPPCRQFTPMLANWYKSQGAPGGGKPVEVVFLSCDHDEKGFQGYFQASHPWMAVDFDDDAREELLAAIRVQGIPRLVVLNRQGRIIVDNAVGQPLDINHWRALEQQGNKK